MGTIRDFTLLAFGGGGPLHACAVAADIGVARIVVPAYPGVFSAYGLLAADVRAVTVRSLVAPATPATWQRAQALFEALEREADALLQAQAVNESERTFSRELDLRYVGQSTELAVTNPATLDDALDAFHARHRLRYGFAVPEEAVEIVTTRVVGIGRTPKPRLSPATVTGEQPPSAGALLERRTAFDGTAFVATPVYARPELLGGDTFAGPAVVEQYDATTYVGRGWRAHVDPLDNLVLERTP